MQHEGTYLPADYAPSQYDVLCGHGHLCHPGNQRFRQIIAKFLPRYEATPSKLHKTIAVVEILKEVRSGVTNSSVESKVIRLDQNRNRWFCITRAAARKKIGQTIRELKNQRDPKNKAWLTNRDIPQQHDSLSLCPSKAPGTSLSAFTKLVEAQRSTTSVSQTLQAVYQCEISRHRRQASEEIDLFSLSDLCQISAFTPGPLSDNRLAELWRQDEEECDFSDCFSFDLCVVESDDQTSR